jgi:hypothetical protein
MILVISSPSSSTTGPLTTILLMLLVSITPKDPNGRMSEARRPKRNPISQNTMLKSPKIKYHKNAKIPQSTAKNNTTHVIISTSLKTRGTDDSVMPQSTMRRDMREAVRHDGAQTADSETAACLKSCSQNVNVDKTTKVNINPRRYLNNCKDSEMKHMLRSS